MMKRVLANVMDFDMHNLFYPRPLLDEIEDAATGAKENMPQVHLRERQYGRSPLIIRPKYTGDFLEKLKEPLEGKSLDVEAADEDNLKDFTMPSEKLKHQEKPTPRVVIDDFYDYNRPGDQAGGEDLKEYWKRDWENTESPEISEDKWLRMWTIPGENYHLARDVVASFVSRENDSDDMINRVIFGYLMDSKLPMVRVAVKMDELMRSRINGKQLVDHGSVTVRAKRYDRNRGRFTFYTESPGPTPPGYAKPYVTVFEFIPSGNIRNTKALDVRVSCTCPSWVFYGAQYKAVLRDYLYGPVRPVYAPPRIRDRAGTFLACKHVVACAKFISEHFLNLPALPPELKKRVEVVKKYKFDIKAPQETIKIPKYLIPVMKRPKIKVFMNLWDQDPRKRRDILRELKNPDEIALFAYKFPSTASALAAERLKELELNPALKQEAKEALDDLEATFGGAPPEKPMAIPVELSHLDRDEEFQKNIKDLENKSDIIKSKLVKGLQDPDKLGYLRFKYDHDPDILSSVLYNLKKIVDTSKDPEGKRKAEHWIHSLVG